MVCVDVNDKNCVEKLSNGLKNILTNKKIVVLCIGSDKVVGDSLGPAIGTMLIDGLQTDVIVYGSL